MSLLRYLNSLLASLLLFCSPTARATVPFTDLAYLSMTPAYTYLSPAMGALCQDYAKNLMLLGSKSSEAVIALQQLYELQPDTAIVNMSQKATAIGQYLEPRDLGTLIGIIVRYKNKTYTEHEAAKKINDLLKTVVARNQCTIKSNITSELKNYINRDNAHYLELEKNLLALAHPKDHDELENALKDIAHEYTKTNAAAVLQALSTKEQRALFQEMEKLHHALQHKRTLLDTEERSSEVSSPILKDSMGALKHALIGTMEEDGTVYVANNTIYLLLAFLYEKSTSKTALHEAYTAMAQAMLLDPNRLYVIHKNKRYTPADYKTLQIKTAQEIAALPLEDIVFARVGLQAHASTQVPHAPTYFKTLLQQYQQAQNGPQKELLEILLAAWAPTKEDIQSVDPRIAYCRFLMQPATTLAERIALAHAICTSHTTEPTVIDAYLDALNNIYTCLPDTLDAYEQFFVSIVGSIIHAEQTAPLIVQLKKQCVQWIQHADTDKAKTAILSVFIKHHLTNAENTDFKPFDQEHSLIAYANNIQSDGCKAKLIISILSSDATEKDLFEWALAMLPAIKDEQAQTEIMQHLLLGNLPSEESLHPLVQQLYAWATTTVELLKDDANKAKLGIAALTMPARIQLTKQNIALRTAILSKTVPSMHKKSGITAVMNYIAGTVPGNDPQILPLWHIAYDWLQQRIEPLADEEHIITVVHALLDSLDASMTQDGGLLTIVYSTVEKGVRAIRTEAKKLYVMHMLLDKPITGQKSHIKLYTALYQWIEEQSASIGDAVKREEVLRTLLAKNKNLNATSPGTHE